MYILFLFNGTTKKFKTKGNFNFCQSISIDVIKRIFIYLELIYLQNQQMPNNSSCWPHSHWGSFLQNERSLGKICFTFLLTQSTVKPETNGNFNFWSKYFYSCFNKNVKLTRTDFSTEQTNSREFVALATRIIHILPGWWFTPVFSEMGSASNFVECVQKSTLTNQK